MRVAGLHVDQESNTPVVVLCERSEPHRVLSVHLGAPEAAAIAMALAGHVPPRPLVHDVMAAMLERLDAVVDAAEVIAVRHGTYIARLVLVGRDGLDHLDARASDAIALAVRLGAPVRVAESVLVAMAVTAERDHREPGDRADRADRADGRRVRRSGLFRARPVIDPDPRDTTDRVGPMGERGRSHGTFDADAIEHEVAEFRAFLEDVAADEFAPDPAD